jgi:hypothetical protein
MDESGLCKFDGKAFAADYNIVKVTNGGEAAITISSVELSVRFGSQ